MNWTKENYPPQMENLYAVVRYKAITIANELVKKENLNPDRAVTTAIFQAKKWAKKRGIKIWKYPDHDG